MQKMKLWEILKNQTITTQFDFSGSCPDKDGETVSFTIFNSAYFINEVKYRFFDRELFVEDESTAFNELVSRFTTWKTARGLMFARMAYAYSLGYNPIENYSSIETHTGHDDFENKKKVTHTWTQDKVERQYTNLATVTSHDQDKDTTTYTQLKDTDKNYRFGVNSADKVQQAENETERTGSESVEHSGTKTDTTNGKYADTHTGSYNDENSGTDSQIYNSTLTKSGNIGVMTASQMLASQFEGINQNLQRRALDEFIQDTTFYCEGVSIWS